jgi:hypothetical protein
VEKNIAIIGTLFYLGHFKGEIIRQITKDDKITMYELIWRDVVNSLGFLKETTVEKKKRVLAGLHEQYKWFTNALCCLSYNYVTNIANDVIELTLIPSVPNVVTVTNYLTIGNCPAHGTTCRNCGKFNHWQSVCKQQSYESRQDEEIESK